MRRGFWVIPAILFVIDRLLKAAALSGLSFSFFGGVVKFELFKNGGIAFSLPLSGPLVWVVTGLVLAAVLASAWKDRKLGITANFTAYALFVLGAVSNLIDRLAYGYTDDYLIFFSRSAVNLADGMILSGALWLAFGPMAERPKTPIAT